MKIVVRLTIIIGILILAAGFNLFLLIQDEQSGIFQDGSVQKEITQILLIVDIATFIFVPFVIRQSLYPLKKISKAISRIKDGAYGEKIEGYGDGEIGELVNSFNVMSDTIKEKEEQAKKTDTAKDEFLAMITHELKTPLVPIQGYSDILLSEHLGQLNPKQKERLTIIKSSAETLLGIISDLLDAQKLDIGKVRMKKEDSDIKIAIAEAVKSFTPQAEKNNIHLEANVQNRVIYHDSERIKQVLTNLIKNAMKVVEPKKGKIIVVMEEEESDIKIAVMDNGIGIPKDKQKHLFKKFYQVDTSTTRESGGSGLGLSICKGIVESHGGELSVESEEGVGSKFLFTIPKIPIELTQKQQASQPKIPHTS